MHFSFCNLIFTTLNIIHDQFLTMGIVGKVYKLYYKWGVGCKKSGVKRGMKRVQWKRDDNRRVKEGKRDTNREGWKSTDNERKMRTEG